MLPRRARSVPRQAGPGAAPLPGERGPGGPKFPRELRPGSAVAGRFSWRWGVGRSGAGRRSWRVLGGFQALDPLDERWTQYPTLLGYGPGKRGRPWRRAEVRGARSRLSGARSTAATSAGGARGGRGRRALEKDPTPIQRIQRSRSGSSGRTTPGSTAHPEALDLRPTLVQWKRFPLWRERWMRIQRSPG